ncbi:hypothetical protein Tco_0933244 [Tanacetum coccineum]
MHHSKRQNHCFLLGLLRLELHKAFVLAVGRLTLSLLPRYTFCFSGLIQCSRRCLILNYFNLGEVNVNSLTVNHVPEKLHDIDPEITFRELGIQFLFLSNSKIILSSWPLVYAVPGQMTHLVASLTLDSTRSCVMHGAFLTKGKASSIPTIFSWGDSISPDGFLPSIMLLLLVIIVAVAIVVTVILVVVVVGEGSSIIKILFVTIGSLHRIMLYYLNH